MDEWIARWSKPDTWRRLRMFYEDSTKPKFKNDVDEVAWINRQFEILGEVGYWSPEWKKQKCGELNARLGILAKQREELLAKEYPDLWKEYSAYSSRWDAAGIYMLEKPTFERWMECVSPKVKDSVQRLMDASDKLDHESTR